MSQKITITTLVTIARTPAASRAARRIGLPWVTWSTACSALVEPLEPALRPGELEREHPEPENDRRDSGARRHEHDDARDEDHEPGDRKRGAVDAVSLSVPVPARAHALDQRGPPARLVLSHVLKVM